MALYAFDGTGNEDKDGDLYDSNVLRFFRAYDDPNKDNDPDDPSGSFYVKGIGQMARTFISDKFAEAFGIGGHRRIRQAMKRLRNNLRAGDRVVDVVGFSRGAAIAVSFANEIIDEHPDLKIRFVGLWDVVGQFGIPGERIQGGHDLDCPRNVQACYHAMALDETRLLFPLTRMQRENQPVAGFTETWFRGVHSDVGGGNGNLGLNWLSLNWMLRAAKREGLPILDDAIAQNLAHRDKPQIVKKHRVSVGPDRRIASTDFVHVSVQRLEGRSPAPELLCRRLDDDCAICQPEAT
jgi:uncharacterized protein (DUF2235 family)